MISSAEEGPCAVSRSERTCACRPPAAPRAASSSEPNEDRHKLVRSAHSVRQVAHLFASAAAVAETH
eukprot:5278407-Pyramimonas_sp.AAC.1